MSWGCTVRPPFSPLQLPQGPLAPPAPPHILSDSVSACNKCSLFFFFFFTVCCLIYANYACWCSTQDAQIVWDESIKSLLSLGDYPRGILLVWSDSERVERVRGGRREHHTAAWYLPTHTSSYAEAEITWCLLRPRTAHHTTPITPIWASADRSRGQTLVNFELTNTHAVSQTSSLIKL